MAELARTRRRTLDRKQVLVEAIREKMEQSKAVLLVDFCGLSAEEMGELRRRLREARSELKVVKNTLALRAYQGAPLVHIESLFKGPTAFVFSFQDVVKTAKALMGYAKGAEKLKVKGGLVEGRICTTAEVINLSRLPGREVLMARLLGAMKGPVDGLVNVLVANLRAFLNVMDAIIKEKGGRRD